jgi:hypothetical protein
LGQTILGIPSAEITNIQNTVFEDIVGTVSEISGWDDAQLMQWAAKAKQVSPHSIHLPPNIPQLHIMKRVSAG